MNEYELWTADGDCMAATYAKAASGAFSSLAEFNASVASGDAPTTTPTPTPSPTVTPGKPEIVVPEGAVEVADDTSGCVCTPGSPRSSTTASVRTSSPDASETR